MEYESDEYDSDSELSKPRLNMKHGFIYHIRKNQVDRDNYDKRIKQSNEDKKKSGPHASKAPTTKLYVPPSQRKTSNGEKATAVKPTGNTRQKSEKYSQKLYVPPNQRKKKETDEPSTEEKQQGDGNHKGKKDKKQLHDTTNHKKSTGEIETEDKPLSSRSKKHKQGKKQPKDSIKDKTSSEGKEKSRETLHDSQGVKRRQVKLYDPTDDAFDYAEDSEEIPYDDYIPKMGQEKKLYDPATDLGKLEIRDEGFEDQSHWGHTYRGKPYKKQLYNPEDDERGMFERSTTNTWKQTDKKQLYDPTNDTRSNDRIQATRDKPQGGRELRENLGKKQLYDPITDKISSSWVESSADKSHVGRPYKGDDQGKKQLFDWTVQTRDSERERMPKGKMKKVVVRSRPESKQLAPPVKNSSDSDETSEISPHDNSWYRDLQHKEQLYVPPQFKALGDGGEKSGGKSLYNLEYTDEEGNLHAMNVRKNDNPMTLAKMLQRRANIEPMYLETLAWKIKQDQLKYGK